RAAPDGARRRPRPIVEDIRRAQAGWIEVITGSMFSGKSEELIRRLRRAHIGRLKGQIFKPRIDDRYGHDHVTSHSDMRIASESVASSRELLERGRPARPGRGGARGPVC